MFFVCLIKFKRMEDIVVIHTIDRILNLIIVVGERQANLSFIKARYPEMNDPIRENKVVIRAKKDKLLRFERGMMGDTIYKLTDNADIIIHDYGTYEAYCEHFANQSKVETRSRFVSKLIDNSKWIISSVAIPFIILYLGLQTCGHKKEDNAQKAGMHDDTPMNKPLETIKKAPAPALKDS